MPGASRASAGNPRLPRAARACGGTDAIIEIHTSLASLRPLNARRHHADDREDLVVEANRLADRIGRVAVGAVPQAARR